MARHGVRRVAGLGREEVAVLAGVNADCCSRLEQGRERDPSASAQVLDALGRALRMDPDAGAHLHPLAGTVPGDAFTRSTDRVAAEMRLLMDSFTDAPAFVVNWALDVLAANGLAEAPGTTTVIEAGHVQAGLSVLGCAYPGGDLTFIKGRGQVRAQPVPVGVAQQSGPGADGVGDLHEETWQDPSGSCHGRYGNEEAVKVAAFAGDPVPGRDGAPTIG